MRHLLVHCMCLGIGECLLCGNFILLPPSSVHWFVSEMFFHELEIRWQPERTGYETSQKRKSEWLLQLRGCSWMQGSYCSSLACPLFAFLVKYIGALVDLWQLMLEMYPLSPNSSIVLHCQLSPTSLDAWS